MRHDHWIRRAARGFLSVEVWAVLALAAAGVFSERLLLVGVVAAGLFLALRWLAAGRPGVRTPLDWPAGALLLLLPLTLLASPLPEISLPQVYRLLLGMALCRAIARYAWSPAGLRGMLAGAVGLGVALGLAALLSVTWFSNKMAILPVELLQDLPRLVGQQVHPNVMAGTLLLLALLGPGWLLFDGLKVGWWGCLLLLLATGFTFGVLFLTQSRGAWLGLGVGLALLVILRWRRAGPAAVLALGLAGGVFLASNPGLLHTWINGNGADINVSTLPGRVVIWARALRQVQEFPLVGMGMGTFAQVTRALYPSFMLAAGDVPHAHNLFLQIALDLGLPGLIAWLVMFIGVLRCAWQVYRAGLRQAGWLAGLGAGLLAAQAAMAVHGLVDAVTWGTRPAVVVWGLWGLALAGWILVRQPPRVAP